MKGWVIRTIAYEIYVIKINSNTYGIKTIVRILWTMVFWIKANLHDTIYVVRFLSYARDERKKQHKKTPTVSSYSFLLSIHSQYSINMVGWFSYRTNVEHAQHFFCRIRHYDTTHFWTIFLCLHSTIWLMRQKWSKKSYRVNCP